jgi:hypothetical protein
MRKLVWLAAFAASVLWAASRPEVNGTWQLDQAHAGKLKFSTMRIQQTADSVQVSEIAGTEGKGKRVDLECGVEGQQCDIKAAAEQVSCWYDGKALVMMEMRHDKTVVIETKFEPSEDGKTLHMEVTHISPPGQKSETYTLIKQAGI